MSDHDEIMRMYNCMVDAATAANLATTPEAEREMRRLERFWRVRWERAVTDHGERVAFETRRAECLEMEMDHVHT